MSLHPTAARCWQAMQIAVYAELAKSLSATGCYRSYDQQRALFEQRYTDTYLPTRNVLTSKRTWLGKTWWLRRGMAPCAVPGTSNHGLGIAVDMGWWVGQDKPGLTDIAGIQSDARGWKWITDNATEFGFSWEGAKPGEPGWEPWHIRYVKGDAIPRRVLDIEAWLEAHR